MIVVAGDLHLAPNTWSSIPLLRGDSYRSFDQIAKYAIDKGANALILPGDVFDAQPPSETVQHFLSVLDRLKKAKVAVLAVQGQHARSVTPWTSIDPYVIDLDLVRTPHNYDGYRISGLDHRSPDELLKALSETDPKTDILVLHQLCRGALPDIAGWDLDPDWVPEHVRLVLMGDLHKVWSCKRKNTEFYYTGSTHMRASDEEPLKSFLVLRKNYELERVPLAVRPFVAYTVQTVAMLDRVVRGIKAQAPETLVHVRYDPRVAGVEEACRGNGKECHFIFRILPLEDVVVKSEVPTPVSMEECLGELVNRETDSALYSFVLELLKAASPKEALGRLKKTILEGA
jgi:DNA repair exonuclease SbcCD nuclease subunit